MPEENFISCDSIGVGKPDPSAYKYVLDKFDQEGLEAWFAAAHMWDVAGAKHVGYVLPSCSSLNTDRLISYPASEVLGAQCGKKNHVPTSLARWM
jgi:hypothetical protein